MVMERKVQADHEDERDSLACPTTVINAHPITASSVDWATVACSAPGNDSGPVQALVVAADLPGPMSR
jgi:hypothetical protein